MPHDERTYLACIHKHTSGIRSEGLLTRSSSMRRRKRVSETLGPIRIYIAHSSKDSRVSKRIAKSLRRRGLEVWYDGWEIRVGDSITQRISHGLEQGDFLIAVLSRNSVKSRWVQKELSAALQIGLFVLPVRIDGCRIPILLRDLRYADLRKGFRQAIEELHDTIVTPLPALESPVRQRRKRRPGRPRIESQPQIRKLVDSIPKMTEERMKDKIAHLASEDKKSVIVEIMDRLSVAEYHDLPDLWYLFTVLDVALQENGRPSMILFEVFIRELASRSLPFCRDQLLRQVSKFAEISQIRQTISDQGLIEWFVSEFEDSSTFVNGALNSEIMAKLQPVLKPEHIKAIVEATLTNNQIYDSWGARDYLRRLFALSDKWLTDQQKIGLQILRLYRLPIRARKEIIIADAKPYEAYKQIENIIRLCRNELAIIDPWVGEDIFTLYLESVPVSASIRIITQNMTGKFEAVAKRFNQERNRFEVRVGQVHDRYLIVDGRAWIIGQSLKDAGKKPLAIMELSDADQARTLFEKLWNSSKKVV
jgi:hypothetical protein